MSDPASSPEYNSVDRLHAIELQLAEYSKHIHELELQHHAMLNSSSWRLTAGLRYIAKIYYSIVTSGLVRVCRNLPSAISTEFHRHGMRGVFRRRNQYIRNINFYLNILSSDISTRTLSMQSLPATQQKTPSRLHPGLWDSEKRIPTNSRVSVIIPTFNAGAEFVFLIRKLQNQQLVGELEIIIVDSGSSDSTVDVASEHGCRVIEIPNSEFSHSGTRNLGANYATGNYLLFMVQDAYPIGDQWLYGMLSYLLEHQPNGVVAVSCAEYSRSDSDMMYDCMINTHYRFLGCLDRDRIGSFTSNEHMALRSQGQLSDVSCLISKTLFDIYQYRGAYAEDLDLGIRLIKDGHKIAMLASVKVIHSHNRPPFYYLKRTFVDVLFLVELFNDFPVRPTLSLQGLLLGIASAARFTSEWLVNVCKVSDRATSYLTDLNFHFSACPILSEKLFLKDRWQSIKIDHGNLDLLLSEVITPYISYVLINGDKVANDEAQFFLDSFSGRITHFVEFANQVYPYSDHVIQPQLADVVRKSLGAAIGAALSFSYLSNQFSSPEDKEWIKRLQLTLKEGV